MDIEEAGTVRGVNCFFSFGRRRKCLVQGILFKREDEECRKF